MITAAVGQGEEQGARPRPAADREAVRQGRHHAAGRGQRAMRGGRHPDRLDRARHGARRRRRPARARRRDLRAGVVGQDHARAAHHRQGAEARAATAAFIDAEHALDAELRARSSAWTSTTCSSRSPTPASRRSRSPTTWCAPARSTSSSSTRSRRWCRGPRSRARWATRTWACRRGSCARRCASSPASISQVARPRVIFINQIRMKIGVMFGNPETTTGGNALKFYASVRLDIRRIAAIKEGEERRSATARASRS